MSTRTRHFGLLMIAQAGCVAVGLWMQHHYLVSSVYHEAEEQTWSALEDRANDLLSKFEPLALPPAAPAARVLERMKALLEDALPDRGGILIVDQEWRIVGQPDQLDQAGTSPLPHGYRVSWSPLAEESDKSKKLIRGRLEMPDGLHAGLARGLENQAGYLVFHLPVADTGLSPARLVGQLPAVSGVTLLWICVLLGIIVYMILARFYEQLERDRTKSAADALRQNRALVRTRDAVIFGLAKLAESRDPETGDHLERICAYSTTLASALRRRPKFRDRITPAFVKLIGISSALHDIGKVGIEDCILCKPEGLIPDEQERMRAHTTIGGQCLKEIERRLGSSNFLQMASEIALAHHERWDGTGYPKGLAGEQIPLSARIVAVADVYDALSSKRVYKEAHCHTACVEMIRSEAGTRFDPDIIQAWLEIEPRFLDIARQYGNAATGDQGGDGLQARAFQEAEVHGGERERLVLSAASAEP